MSKSIRKKQSVTKRAVDLNTMSEDKLLNMRICDLPLSIEGTWLEECIGQLYNELKDKGIVFSPACYLADEWLTPENEIIIGIPFYLAHPALIRLEKKMMLEAEGETRDWCMKLLRHEAGHAISYAYRLNKKKKWKEIFGSSSQEYPETYRFRPYSRSFVRHLDGFYAQYHPDEDFVETFAVWLTPGCDWENRYKGWKAIGKLRYVDKLMKGIANKVPDVRRSQKFWHYKTLRITLKNFYRKKMNLRAEDFPDFHDGNLKQIFAVRDEQGKGGTLATEILQKYKRSVINTVAKWSGEKKYVVYDLLKAVFKRTRELKLVTREDEAETVLNLSAYLTTLIMNYSYTGWYRGNKNKKAKE